MNRNWCSTEDWVHMFVSERKRSEMYSFLKGAYKIGKESWYQPLTRWGTCNQCYQVSKTIRKDTIKSDQKQMSGRARGLCMENIFLEVKILIKQLISG